MRRIFYVFWSEGGLSIFEWDVRINLAWFERRSQFFWAIKASVVLTRCAGFKKIMGVSLSLAEVAQIDPRVRQCFESIVYFADEFEPEQQAFKLIFPGEDTLNGAKPFFKDSLVE